MSPAAAVHDGGGADVGKSACFSRAGKMPVIMTSSALAKDLANWCAKNLVRENRCGWKITRMVESGYRRRAASSRAAISVGMMGVIVHYSDLLDRAAHLEAACRTEECAVPPWPRCGAHAQQHGSADGGGRIARIVHARNLQGNGTTPLPAVTAAGRCRVSCSTPLCQRSRFPKRSMTTRHRPNRAGNARSAVGNGMGFHVGGQGNSSTASPSVVDH